MSYRINPLLGHMQDEFFTLTQPLGDRGYDRNNYLYYFRPPVISEEPLLAKISLKSPKLKIDSDQQLCFLVNFVREYVDSRLEYNPKLLLTGKQSKNYADFPVENYSTRLWAPAITVANRDEADACSQSSYDLERERRTARVLVTPEGKVYDSQPIAFRIKPANVPEKSEDKYESLEYRLVLSEDKEPIDSLKLQWDSTKAFIESVESLTALKNAEGTKLRKIEDVKVTFTDGSSRTEEFGGEFGQMTFSSLELIIKLKLEKEKEEDKKKDSSDKPAEA